MRHRAAADTTGRELRGLHGLDFSREVLASLQEHLAGRDDLRHVELRHGPSHDLQFAEDDSFDLVIINSVAQYFPNVHYLVQVLRRRSKYAPWRAHFYRRRAQPAADAGLLCVRAALSATAGDAGERIAAAEVALEQAEEELLIDPALFEELGRQWDKNRPGGDHPEDRCL